MKNKQETKNITVRYSETSSLFCSQFLVNSTSEDVTVGFSSGYMRDPSTNETSLPIHSRVSMTPAGARRLYELLGKALAMTDSTGTKSVPADQKN